MYALSQELKINRYVTFPQEVYNWVHEVVSGTAAEAIKVATFQNVCRSRALA